MTQPSRPPGAPWRVLDVAEHLGVKQNTVSSYLSRGQMPAADGRDQYGPWWHEETILGWRRPGMGNRTGPRGHRPRKT